MNKQERKEEFEKYKKNYKKILKKIEKYHGFCSLEVGVKVKDGKRMEEIVYRVNVEKKVKLSDLKEKEIIPDEIDGFKLDICEDISPVSILGVTSLPDSSKYDLIHGGISVGNGTGGTGTIGCLATRDSDNKAVILSNKHVLYTGGVADGQKEGHPEYTTSCCCDCNVIGTNVDEDDEFDCAIALLDDDVRTQNTIEEIGTVNGVYLNLMPLDEIRKRGKTTGLTAGIVDAINIVTGRVTVDVKAGEGRQIGYFDSSDNEVLLGAARALNFVGLTRKYNQGSEKLAYAGDSGSVMVYHSPGDADHNKVAVLLNTIDGATNTQGLGFLIEEVTNALNITIHSGATLPGISTTSREVPLNFTTIINKYERRLSRFDFGKELIRLYYSHANEIGKLVNTNRRATVLWQRNNGPKFIAVFQQSIEQRGYQIPFEIDGTTREDLMSALFAMVENLGSEQLKADLDLYRDDISNILIEITTAEGLLRYARKKDLKLSKKGIHEPV